MAEGGLDARTWLTIIGVFVLLFALPGFVLEMDRRKRERDESRSHRRG